MLKRRKDDGFTLIELMIVIAVIGILAVVLVPKFGNVKTSAKLTGVQTNYKSVIAALQGQTFTDNTSVYNFLNTTFTGNNAMTNPINTNLKNVSSSASTPGVVIVDNTAAAPPTAAPGNDNYKGAVVVIPALTGGSGTIAVYGCDDKGLQIPDLSQTLQF